MNDPERRRRQLLEETRERYSDRFVPPAVHPRYGSSYRKLYGEEEIEGVSTFGVRAFFLSIAVCGVCDNGYEKAGGFQYGQR